MLNSDQLYSAEDVGAFNDDYQREAIGWLGNSISDIKYNVEHQQPAMINIHSATYNWEWSIVRMSYSYADSPGEEFNYMYIIRFVNLRY